MSRKPASGAFAPIDGSGPPNGPAARPPHGATRDGAQHHAGTGAQHHAGEAGATATHHTGTTAVALLAGDAAVVAADRRASLGGRFVGSKDVRKVARVHPRTAVAASGPVGGIQRFVRTLRAEADLYEARRGEPMSVDALATAAGAALRGRPIQAVVGGVDDDGPQVYEVDGGGGVVSDDYAAAGSGMQVAYGVLERQYDPGFDPAEGRRTAAAAVGTASERDAASGDGLHVATATDEGVAVEGYDDPEEV